MQSTSTILMIRPAAFGVDAEAEPEEPECEAGEDVCALQERVEAEFDAAAEALREKGVDVFVIEDTVYPPKPEAVFPCNWVSFHDDGTAVLYPIAEPERRCERRIEIIEGLRSAFEVGEIVDLSENELDGRFLEGTASMVLDRANLIAYASVSTRTDEWLFIEVCERLGFRPITFRSSDHSGREIEHTNTVMSVAANVAVVCLDAVSDKAEQDALAASVRDTGHQLIDITFEQMENWAANMITLRTATGSEIVALSRSAFEALSGRQRTIIERSRELVPLDIPTIETDRGGSVRGMIAEIFLPRRPVDTEARSR